MTSRLYYLIHSEGFLRWFRLLPTVAIAVVAIVLPTILMDSGRAAAPQAPAPQPPAPYQSPLGLRATSKPQQLQAYWDRNQPAIQNAVEGVLRINDGDASEVIPFDAQQLHDGYVAYRPMTNDVSLRLEVKGSDGQSVSESVRVVAMP